MPGNSFGELFRVTTAGVSHGPGYVVIIDGCPPGLPLSVDDLLPDLRRRRPGQSKIVTQRQEEDLPEIWSGVFEGVTDGTSIGILFRNTDQRSRDYGDIKDKYRPGHADFTFDAKYGLRDYRGGGRSSRPRNRLPRRRRGRRQEAAGPRKASASSATSSRSAPIVADIPDPTAGDAGTGRGDAGALSRSRRGRPDDRADRGGAQGPGLDRRRLRAGGDGRAGGAGRAGLRQAQGRPGQGAAVAAGGDGVRVRRRLRRGHGARQREQRRLRSAPSDSRRSAPRRTATAACWAASAAASRSSAAWRSSRPAACRAAADRDARRRADRDRDARPARSLSAAASTGSYASLEKYTENQPRSTAEGATVAFSQ